MVDPITVLDAFFSGYLECDLSRVTPGRVWVIPSDRREMTELHYSSPFALWLLTSGNRCVASVQRNLEPVITRVVNHLRPGEVRDITGQRRLLEAVAAGLRLPRGLSASSGPVFFCTRRSFRRRDIHPCRRVQPADITALSAAGLYDSSLDSSIAAGTCFVALDGASPVSLAGTREVPHLADKVADMFVPGTIAARRREGFGQTAVSAATAAVLDSGRIPLYTTSDHNPASILTAQAVGYSQYGWQFRVELVSPD
uniref:Uncharacterized protein n=1 Tax=candidate division WOR-3 bacterium TaxID=2052148 RepID=A0A7C4GCX6_UNCW3